MIIYKLTNKLNGKVYIGQTKRTLNKRLSEHLKKNKTPISKALRSVGIENFNVSVVDHAHCKSELDEKERFYIKFYNSIVPNGYNICIGGEGARGLKHSKETKLKMHNSHVGKGIGKDNPMFGRCGPLNPFYGLKHTNETKRKLSDLAKKNFKYAGNPRAKKVKCIETNEVFDCITLAAEKYGLNRGHINNCCTGTRKRCGGYHWCYAK